MGISQTYRILLLVLMFGTSFSARAFQESESLEASTQSLYEANEQLQKELSSLQKKVRKRFERAYPEMSGEPLDSLIKQELALKKETLKAQAKDTVTSYLKDLKQKLAQELKETPENLPVAKEIQKSIAQLQELEEMQVLLKDPRQLRKALDIRALKGLERQVGNLKPTLADYKSLFKGWDQKLLAQVTNLPQARLIKEQVDKMKTYKPLPDGYRGRVEQFQTNDFVKEQLEAKAEELKRAGAASLQEKLDAAQSKISGFKEKFPSLPSIEEAPKRYNPNKGRPFFKRLLLGGDLQVNREKPVSVNAALRLTYPLSKRAAVGIAGAGRIFLARPDQNQQKEDQLSIRNFVQYNIGEGFYLQANYEFTRRDSQSIESPTGREWVQNALLGIGRRVRVTPEINMSITALYDFFYRIQTSANNSPLVFRVGFDLGKNK